MRNVMMAVASVFVILFVSACGDSVVYDYKTDSSYNTSALYGLTKEECSNVEGASWRSLSGSNTFGVNTFYSCQLKVAN